MRTAFSESAQNSLRFHCPKKSHSFPTFYTGRADDARETPPRLAVSDSRLSWERGVVLPPFEACQTWAVDLAVDLAHGRVQRMPPVSVSNCRAVQLYQLLCDVKTRPASCRGLAFWHFLGRCRPCTSASRLLGWRNCCHACRCSTRFDETKISSSRGCFRSSARLCRSAQERGRAGAWASTGQGRSCLRSEIWSLGST